MIIRLTTKFDSMFHTVWWGDWCFQLPRCWLGYQDAEDQGLPECYKAVSGSVHVSEIEWDQKAEAGQMDKAEEYVVYLNQAEELRLMTPKSEPIQITIQPSTFELFSFVPVTKLGCSAKFAPVGLTNMFNCGGTIQELEYNGNAAKIKVKGGGIFLAYSIRSPKKGQLNGAEVAFEWSPDGRLTLNVPWTESAGGASDVVFYFQD